MRTLNYFAKFLCMAAIIVSSLFSLSFVNTDAASVYQAIIKRYNSAKTLDVKFSVLVKGDETSDENMVGCRIAKSGTNYYSKVGQSEVINIQPYSIQIDHQDKRVYVSDYQVMPDFMELSAYKQVLKSPSASKLRSNSATSSTLTIKTGDFTTPMVEITYDPVSFNIQQYVTYHQEMAEYGDDRVLKSSISCTYDKQLVSDEAKAFPEHNFNNYLVKKGGKYHLTSKYKAYQLILAFER